MLEKYLPERKIKLLEYLRYKGELKVSQLPKTVLRDIYSLTEEGFIKIDKGMVTLTHAGQQALGKTPRLEKTKLMVKKGKIVLGKGSEGYILKTKTLTRRSRKTPEKDKKAIIDKARQLLLEGKIRYAAIILLKVAETQEEKIRVKRLIEQPDPRKLRHTIQYFRKKLDDIQHDKDNADT